MEKIWDVKVATINLTPMDQQHRWTNELKRTASVILQQTVTLMKHRLKSLLADIEF